MKKLLALLLSAAMAMSMTVMPASADEYLNEFKDDFSEAVVNRLEVVNAETRDETANGLGTVYQAKAQFDGSDEYITYKVTPGTMAMIEYANYSTLEGDVITVKGSADQTEWTEVSGYCMQKGNVNVGQDKRSVARTYKVVAIPEDVNYMRVCFPQKGTYVNWTLLIISVEVRSAYFEDTLDSAVADFLNSEDDNYVPQRWSTFTTGGASIGKETSGYGHCYGYKANELGLVYMVRPEKVMKVVTNQISATDARSLAVDFHANGTWERHNGVQIGTTTVKIGENNYIQKTWVVGVPEGEYFAKVVIPSMTNDGDNWSFGIDTISLVNESISDYVYPEEFVDELDTTKDDFMDNTKTGYVKNRISYANVERRDPTDPTDTKYDGGAWQAQVEFSGSDAYFTYKVTPGKMAEVLYTNNSVLTGDVITIKTSVDGVNYTAVDGGYVELDKNNKTYYKYALIPQNAEYMRVCFPAKSTYTNWHLYISKIALRSVDFNDTLDRDPSAFTDTTKTDYVSQAAYLSATGNAGGFVKNGSGALGYAHCYGYKANEPYMIYGVYPGRTLSVVAEKFSENESGETANDSRVPYIEFTTDGGANWVRVKTTAVALDSRTESPNTYVRNKYMAVVPEGAYAAKVIMPAMEADGGNWSFAIDTVTLNSDVIPHDEYEWDTPLVGIEGTDGYVSVNITKYSGNAENITVYFASYDSENNLVDVQLQTEKLETTDGKNVGEYYVFGDASVTNKAFIWGANNRPLTKVIPVTAE